MLKSKSEFRSKITIRFKIETDVGNIIRFCKGVELRVGIGKGLQTKGVRVWLWEKGFWRGWGLQDLYAKKKLVTKFGSNIM